MAKFKLIAGKHRQGARTYKIGDVIESDSNLARIFANKFQQVEDGTPATEAAGARVFREAPSQASLEATKTAIRKGENTALPTQDSINSRPGRGPVLTQEDLEERERIAQEQEHLESDENEETEEEATAHPKGKNVTRSFASAHKADLVVRKEGEGAKATYNVFDPDDASPDEALNSKPLKKAEVESFVKKHTKK